MPWPLIPYRTYDVKVLLSINSSRKNGSTYMKIANEILPRFHSIEYGLMLGLLTEYIRLWEAVLLRWSLFTDEHIYINNDIKPDSIESLTGMAMFYWHIGNGFLVGNPSQSRRSRPPP